MDGKTDIKEVHVVTLREGFRRIASRVRSGPRAKQIALAVLVPLVLFSFSSVAPADAVSPSPSAAFRYSVREGDALWKIAIKYNTTVHDLIQANRLKNPDLINIGQILWIPSNDQMAARAAPQAARVAPKYVFPIRGYRGTVPNHWGGLKGAADLIIAEGTPIYAVTGGRVISAGSTAVGGWNMMIQGDDGRQYYYAHFRERAKVKAGEHVVAGQHIANVGNTGNSATPHLHLAIGSRITLAGNAEGLRPGYGVSFDVAKFLNSIR